MCSGHSLALFIPFVAMLGRVVIACCKSVRHSSVDWNVMCLSLELDFENFTLKNFRMLAASDDTSEASCAYAVSVPTTPSWGVLVLLLESVTRRRTEKSKHVAETLLREFLSNVCSPSCLDNLLRFEAPAHGDSFGHDAVVDNGSGLQPRHDIGRFSGAFYAAGPMYGCRSTALLHER